MSTEISSTIVQRRQACSKASTSKCARAAADVSPLFLRKHIRLSEARLHAVSSRNMYSEHGLDARMGPLFGHVCQSLMVVWNWMPGSADAQAAWPIWSHSSRAFNTLTGAALSRAVSCQSPSASTAARNSSVTRTELLEFWPETVRYASESQSVS